MTTKVFMDIHGTIDGLLEMDEDVAKIEQKEFFDKLRKFEKQKKTRLEFNFFSEDRKKSMAMYDMFARNNCAHKISWVKIPYDMLWGNIEYDPKSTSIFVEGADNNHKLSHDIRDLKIKTSPKEIYFDVDGDYNNGNGSFTLDIMKHENQKGEQRSVSTIANYFGIGDGLYTNFRAFVNGLEGISKDD